MRAIFVAVALFASTASAELVTSDKTTVDYVDDSKMKTTYTYWHTYDDGTPNDVTFYETWDLELKEEQKFTEDPSMRIEWFWCDWTWPLGTERSFFKEPANKALSN